MPYFPNAVMRPNTKSEAADAAGVQDIISASDFNKHDAEIIAIEKTIGLRRPNPLPPGFTCHGDTPECSGAVGPCAQSSYGISEALRAALSSVQTLHDSCKTCSGVIQDGGKIPFPSDWLKTSLIDNMPFTSDKIPSLTIGSVNGMPNEGYVTIINDISAGTDRKEVVSSDWVWQSKHVPPRGWTHGPNMLYDRYYGAEGITLTQGRGVLIVGGISLPTWGAFANSESERYDPVTNTFMANGPVNSPKIGCRLAGVANNVLATGGRGSITFGDFPAGAKADVFDPVTNTWTAAPDMSTARWRHTLTSLPGNKAIAVGGIHFASLGLISCEIYDLVSNTWSSAANLHAARYGHSAVALPDGRVLITGGNTTSGIPSTKYEIYDPVGDTWTEYSCVGQMGETSADSPLALIVTLDGKVLVSGDLSSTGNSVFDPNTNAMTATAPGGPVYPKTVLAALLPDGNVLVVSGSAANFSGAGITHCWLYDPRTNSWSTTNVPNISRATSFPFQSATLISLSNGSIAIMGGTFSPGSTFSGSQLYSDPGHYGKTTETFDFLPEYTSYQPGIIKTTLPSGTIGQQVTIYVSSINSSKQNVSTKLSQMVVGAHVVLSQTTPTSCSGTYVVSSATKQVSGYKFDLTFVEGDSAVAFTRSNPIHFALITEIMGHPVYSSLASTDSPIFVINDSTGTSLSNPDPAAFTLGSNVEVLFYSGIDCDNSKLLNVRRGCKGTNITRHGIHDLVFKGIVSIQLSPAMLIGSDSIDGSDCFLRSNGSVRLRSFGLSDDTFSNNTSFAYVSYQCIMNQTLDPIRAFNPHRVDDACLLDAGPPAPCTNTGSDAAPSITSGLTLLGYVHTPISYSITGTGAPFSFGATGLPTGLSVDTRTGIISGTVTSTSVTSVTITATNDIGTDTKTLAVTILSTPVPVVRTDGTNNFQGVVGIPFLGQVSILGIATGYSTSGVDIWYGLPQGIYLNATTGSLYGTPIGNGQTYSTTLTAINLSGSDSGPLNFSIASFPNKTKVLTIAAWLDIGAIPTGPTGLNFYPLIDGLPAVTFVDDPNTYQLSPGVIPEMMSSPRSAEWRVPPTCSFNLFPSGSSYVQRFSWGRSDTLQPTQPWQSEWSIRNFGEGFPGSIARFTLNKAGTYTTYMESFYVVANGETFMDLVPITPDLAHPNGSIPLGMSRIPRQIISGSDWSGWFLWVDIYGPSWTTPYWNI